MRGARYGLAVVALCGSALLTGIRSVAQEKPQVFPASVNKTLENSTLVVWFVEPATPLEMAQIALKRDAAKKMLPTTVQQSTAGSFGQTASSVGQTAGSYGVSPSQVGTSASNTGKPASQHGTNAGNFGQNASQVGQNAGDAGQPAGNFGQAASDVGTTAGNYSPGMNNANWGSDKRATQVVQEEQWTCEVRSVLAERRISQWSRKGQDACGIFHGFHLRVVVVPDEDVQDRLKRVEGTKDYPDVIFGTQRLPWWNESGLGLTMLGWPVLWPPGTIPTKAEDVNALRLGAPVILRRALHSLEARAFVVWLRDEELLPDSADVSHGIEEKAAQVAMGALSSMLTGGGLEGERDEQAAKFDAGWAQLDALTPSQQGVPENLLTRVSVIGVREHKKVAVVSLSAMVGSIDAFGVVHALAYLRKNAAGAWKVLQITPNLWPGEMQTAADILEYRPDLIPANFPATVSAVSLASPIDNDVRSPGTELWWDNNGSAVTQVVEWQMGNGSVWSEPRIFALRDLNPRTQTRVAPDFTKMSGTYRWRVWSVGLEGTMAFTPWRGLTITR